MDTMTACLVMCTMGIILLVVVKIFGVKPDVELSKSEVKKEMPEVKKSFKSISSRKEVGAKSEIPGVKKFVPSSQKAELIYIHKGFVVYRYKYLLGEELARQLKGAMPLVKRIVPATAVIILALYLCTGLYNMIPKGKKYVAYHRPPARQMEVVRAQKRGVLFWIKPDGVKGRNPDKRNDALDIVLDRNDAEVMAFTVNYHTDDGKPQVAKFRWDKQREQYGNWSQSEPKGSGLWSVESDPDNNKIFHGVVLNDTNEQAKMEIVMN